MEIGNLPEKEFRIMRVKMNQDLGKRMEAKIKIKTIQFEIFVRYLDGAIE